MSLGADDQSGHHRGGTLGTLGMQPIRVSVELTQEQMQVRKPSFLLVQKFVLTIRLKLSTFSCTSITLRGSQRRW